MPKLSQKEKDALNRSTGNLFISLFFALICMLFGLFLGIANLAIIPVSTVSKMPDADKIESHTVYYVQARDRGGSSYKGKETTLLGDRKGNIVLSGAELNTWARDSFRFTKPDDEGKPVVIIPSAPKFNINEGTINMAVNLEIEVFGKRYDVLYQTQGTFQVLAGKVIFVPEQSYLGSARLPNEIISPLVSDYVLSIFKGPEKSQEILDAWDDLSDVRVEGNLLTLVKG